MTDAAWKHELSREQYELLIDSILRASTIATVIEQTVDDLEPATLKEMIQVLRERMVECLAFGQFDEEDVREINKAVLESMYAKPDA